MLCVSKHSFSQCGQDRECHGCCCSGPWKRIEAEDLVEELNHMLFDCPQFCRTFLT